VKLIEGKKDFPFAILHFSFSISEKSKHAVAALKQMGI
jgi:hypothetical protein